MRVSNETDAVEEVKNIVVVVEAELLELGFGGHDVSSCLTFEVVL
jgi:hypothetical protein